MPNCRFISKSISLFALSVCASYPARAQVGGQSESAKTPSAKAQVDSGAEIIVTGRRRFLSADTSGTTGLPLAIEKVPQSISLINSDFIKAADLKNLVDIAEHTPGALNAGNYSGESSALTLRGFPIQQSIDGINIATTYEQDYSIYDRIEIVKGPSSVVFGVSSPGGVVNFATKGASRSSPSYLYGQVGSYNSFRAEGQVASSLDSAGDVRGLVVAVHDRGDSFIDVINHRITALYGSLDFNAGSRLSGYLHTGYQRNTRTGFDGVPTFADGTPAPVSRSFFIGSAGPGLKTDAYLASAGLKYEATNALELGLRGLVQDTDAGGSIRSYSFGLQSNGDLSVTKLRESLYKTLNYGIAANTTYRLDALGFADSFITANVLYQNSHYDTIYSFYQYDDGSGGSSINGLANIFAGDRAVSAVIDSGTLGPAEPRYVTDSQTLTLSSQAVVQVANGLSVLLGGSYSIPSADLTNGSVKTHFKFANTLSKRAGLTYEVAKGTDTYVSYSESFLPQQFTDVNNSILPPLTGRQFEAGVKHRAGNGKLLLTAAIFQIDQSNSPVFDISIGGTDRFKALGKVRHRGGELQATGEVFPGVQVSAGYAYLDAKILKDVDPTIVGARRPFLPRHSATLFTTYAPEAGPLRGFTIGGGGRFVGSMPTAFDGSTKPLPGYLLVDATAGYQIGRVGLQINARNIFNKRYYTNTYQTYFYGNQPGEPATIVATIRVGLGKNGK